MRLIDQIATRSAAPVPLEALRTANTPPEGMREQYRAHVIDMARWLAGINAEGRTVGSLRASEQREFERRRKVLADLLAASTQTTLSLHQARWLLVPKHKDDN